MSSVMACGENSRASVSAVPPAESNQNFDTPVVREVHQYPGEGDATLTISKYRVARVNDIAIVVDFNVVHHRGRRCRRGRQDHIHFSVGHHHVIGGRQCQAYWRPCMLRCTSLLAGNCAATSAGDTA